MLNFDFRLKVQADVKSKTVATSMISHFRFRAKINTETMTTLMHVSDLHLRFRLTLSV